MRPIDDISLYVYEHTMFKKPLRSQVPPYFEMILEIYCHELEVQGIASTPQKLARSIGRAVGRTWSKNTKDFENIGPKFELVASTTLTIDDCSEGISIGNHLRY